jgi:LPXTG-motif cell wall-anchored protein
LSAGIISQFPAQFDQSTIGEYPLRSTMRKLWEDHITWTRLYIVEAAADLPGKDATAQRLLRNQTDIGNAVKPTFGEEAGNRLTALLRDHITGAVELIAAAKAGDNAKFEAANGRWYANGNDIAAFLSAANPASWPLETMKSEMKMHLDVTLEEASKHLQADWGGSIQAYDHVHDHILRLADTLSSGVMQAKPAAGMPSALPRTGGADTTPLLAALTGIALLAAIVVRRKRAATG